MELWLIFHFSHKAMVPFGSHSFEGSVVRWKVVLLLANKKVPQQN